MGVCHWKGFFFCNLDINEVSEFGSGVSARALGAVAGYEEDRNSNIMTNDISKLPSNSINIYHNFVTYIKDSEMIKKSSCAQQQTIDIVPSYSNTYFTAEQSQIHQKWTPKRYRRFFPVPDQSQAVSLVKELYVSSK